MLAVITARLHSNERSCHGEPHSGRFMERQWKMLTQHETHAKAGPLVGMFIRPDKDALWTDGTAGAKATLGAGGHAVAVFCSNTSEIPVYFTV